MHVDMKFFACQHASQCQHAFFPNMHVQKKMHVGMKWLTCWHGDFYVDMNFFACQHAIFSQHACSEKIACWHAKIFMSTWKSHVNMCGRVLHDVATPTCMLQNFNMAFQNSEHGVSKLRTWRLKTRTCMLQMWTWMLQMSHFMSTCIFSEHACLGKNACWHWLPCWHAKNFMSTWKNFMSTCMLTHAFFSEHACLKKNACWHRLAKISCQKMQ